MSETVHERIRIEADVDHCLAVVLNFEAYPEWARDLKKVTVLERDEEGRGTSVEYRCSNGEIRYVCVDIRLLGSPGEALLGS